MCGIAGYVQRASTRPASINDMLGRIAHRGPDGVGQWSTQTGDWQITLGHRRLAIIDLTAGKQPMCNEDERVQITFNGEIYNFNTLRQPLETLGHLFHTRSDTETIIHHFEQYGTQGLRDLNGMFAFAIWDHNTQTLTLARDRMGIKPLYYSPLPDGGIAFASELTSLLAHDAIAKDLDPRGVASLFFRDYAHAPGTMIRNVYKLAPAHFIQWTPAGLSAPQAFWNPYGVAPDLRNKSAADLTLELRQLISDSVRAQLISDVPIGIFLSGGIDSSIIAASAQKLIDQPVSTFSIGFNDPDFDESVYADIVARHIGSKHFVRRIDEEDMLNHLDRALACLDEPMADPSILPTYMLCELASEHVKVVLGGDGGDELFAGYPTYKAHNLAPIYKHIPHWVRKHLLCPAIARLPMSRGYQRLDWKLKRFALRWMDDPIQRHQSWMSSASIDELRSLMPDQPTPWVNAPDVPLDRLHPDELNQILLYDQMTYMPGSVLTKVDRASMAHGLEVRPPLLDNPMVDFALSQPSSLKLHGGQSKWLLKQAAESLIPSEIIHRKKKGFAIPLNRWIATAFRPRLGRILSDSPIWDHKIVQRNVAQQWLNDHCNNLCDHSRPLWALITLDAWLQRLP